VGLNITFDDTIFDQGGLLYFGPTEKAADDWLRRAAAQGAPPLDFRAAPQHADPTGPARQGNSIQLTGVNFDRPGEALIVIEQFNCPITVEDCDLTTDPRRAYWRWTARRVRSRFAIRTLRAAASASSRPPET